MVGVMRGRVPVAFTTTYLVIIDVLVVAHAIAIVILIADPSTADAAGVLGTPVVTTAAAAATADIGARNASDGVGGVLIAVIIAIAIPIDAAVVIAATFVVFEVFVTFRGRAKIAEGADVVYWR